MDHLDPTPILEKCAKHDYVLDVFTDRAGTVGVSILVDNEHYTVLKLDHGKFMEFMVGLHSRTSKCIMYDMRKLELLGIRQQLGSTLTYDVKLLFDSDSLFRTAKAELPSVEAEELEQAEQQVKAHLRACKTAKVDMGRHSILRLVPQKLFRKMLRLRSLVTLRLWEKKLREDPGGIRDYEERVFPLACALYEVERNGIRIDREYVTQQLKANHPPAVAKFLRSMDELSKPEDNGYAYTQFNPVGGKTGRFKVASGFNCMGIPHGVCRKGIVSRFPGGKIYAFDYNAIDYRCIVASLDDKDFVRLYDGVDDFHARTTSFLFGTKVDDLRRDVVKKLTYISVYGGSVETIADKTGLSVQRAAEVLDRLNEKLAPIHAFREKLFRESKEQGYVLLPNGRKIPITADDHPGKVLGLYAQGFSSYVFEEAFKATVRLARNFRRSKVLFTVHDELVMDMHPDEFVRDVEVMDAMEWAVEGYGDMFKVKINCGENYGEATD